MEPNAQNPEANIVSLASILPTGTQTQGFAAVDACQLYHTAKPYIDFALPYLKSITYGAEIVKVIELLETLADRQCPRS